MKIILGNYESEFNAIISELESNLSYFETKKDKIDFIKYTIKNNPFGLFTNVKTIVKPKEVIKHFSL